MMKDYKRLGDYIKEVNIRNTDLTVKTLLGVSVKKKFISSIANTVGTNMKRYKIVLRNEFVYIPDTSRRGEKIGIAMLDSYDEAIVSQAYTVFKIIDEEKLLPEYVMMWFRRPEFDRYARYKSHGSVREAFDWDELCEVELPIPSIEKQHEIVKEYKTVTNRIKLNEQINQKLEETAQTIYKHWFVDFEFPNDDGLPYKSNGGEMVYNEVLDREVPVGWEVVELGELSKIKGGKRLPKGHSLTNEKLVPYIRIADLDNNKFLSLSNNFLFIEKETESIISRYKVKKGDLILSIVGTIGLTSIIDESLDTANLTENCVKITMNKELTNYLYHFLKSERGKNEIRIRNVGAVQAKLPIYNIESLKILVPKDSIFKGFEKTSNEINKRLVNYQKQNQELEKLKNLLLSRMSRG